MSRPQESPDVLTIGRLGVDLYPLEAGVPLEEVSRFGRFLGGSAANVAVAAARLGLHSGLHSRVGDDPFGRFLQKELQRLGVDTGRVRVDPRWKTPLTFCEIFPPDDFPLYFYRQPMAPDLAIEVEADDEEAARTVPLLWFTATGLSRQPSLDTHRTMLEARDRAGHTVFDLDYRPMFWESQAIAHDRMHHALAFATVAVGNRQECEVAVGESDPARAARALLDAGVRLAIVKRGPDGVLAMTDEETVEIPAHHIDVLNGLGAGDAFGGALCLGLLRDWGLERTLRFANAAGAIVASRLECSTAMPEVREVEAVMNGLS